MIAEKTSTNPYGIRLRRGWRDTTLGELTSHNGGFIQTGPFGSQLHAHDYKEDGTPVVMPQQLGDNAVTTDGIARIGDADVDRLCRHVMAEGDIVFSRRGDVTRRAYVSARESGWLCGTGCLLVRISHPDCENRFVALFLSLAAAKSYLIQKAVGATMPNLNQGILEALPIVLPPLSSQRRIVAVLSHYDDLIDNNTCRIKLLEDAVRLLHGEWFVRLRFPGREHTRLTDGMPSGWTPAVFGDLCDEVREHVDPGQVSPDTPYIGLEHMPRRSITLNSWGTAEEVTSSKHRYLQGDILFGKIRSYFHKVGITLTDGVTSSDAIVIRPQQESWRSLVLLTASSDHFVNTTAQTAKEGSKMPRADWKQMKQFRCPIPPAGILDVFNRTVEPILAQLRTLTIQSRRAREARDLLLPRLMSGEVAV